MLIQCAQAVLEKRIQSEQVDAQLEDPLFSWYFQLVEFLGENTVLCVNNETRFLVILHGLSNKDLLDLDRHIIDGIRQAFRHECIKDEVIEAYLQQAGPVVYGKPEERSLVFLVSGLKQNLVWHEKLIHKDKVYQPDVSREIMSFFYRCPLQKFIFESKRELCVSK